MIPVFRMVPDNYVKKENPSNGTVLLRRIGTRNPNYRKTMTDDMDWLVSSQPPYRTSTGSRRKPFRLRFRRKFQWK